MTTPNYRRKVPLRARGVVDRVPMHCPTRKHAWLDRHGAVRAARRTAGETGVPLSVYRCPECRQYHMTSHRR